MKKLNALILIGLTVFALACKKKDNSKAVENLTQPETNYAFSAEARNYRNAITQNTSFNAQNFWTWTSTKGTVLQLPSNSLKDQNGNIYQGDVELSFIEIYTPKDMILAQRPTVTNDLQVLQTSGEFMVEFKTPNGDLLQLNNNPLKIETAPNFSVVGNMQGFSGIFINDSLADNDSSFVWEEDNNINVLIDTTGLVNGMFIDSLYPSIPWINCDQYIDYPNGAGKPEIIIPGIHVNAMVYIYDQNINAVLSPYERSTNNGNTFYSFSDYYQGIPIGHDIKVIVRYFDNEQHYFDIVDHGVLQGDDIIQTNPTPMTIEEIYLLLDNL